MNRLKSFLLLALLSAILVAIGGMVAGRDGAMYMFLISLAINFVSYWNCDKIALASYQARELTEREKPELFSLVRELTERAGMPMPRLYVIPSDVPNAFATGRDEKHAAVAVTEGLLSMLDRDELAGVLGHELTHVKHRDTLLMTLAASIAGAISWIANMAQWAAIFGGGRNSDGEHSNPLGLMLVAIIAPIAALFVQMALSRSREYMADAGGAAISGKPLALASALQKLDGYAHRRVIRGAEPSSCGLFIINPLCGVRSFSTNLFSTHPSTEERIKRLREIAAQMR